IEGVFVQREAGRAGDPAARAQIIVHPLRQDQRRLTVRPVGGVAIDLIFLAAPVTRVHVADAAVALIVRAHDDMAARSEEHTSELQSLMRSSYAVFCLKK